MIWIILILAALALAAAEKRWADFSLEVLSFRGSCSKEIAEPGEILQWQSSVINSGRLSIPFVRLRQVFPAEANFNAEAKWLDSHCQEGIYQTYVKETMSVRARSTVTKQLSFSLPHRGKYSLGACILSAGDLLGFGEKSMDFPGDEIVICPERSKNTKKLNALGGFLGDVSVRRFILEDPMLTVGFRNYTGREPMKAISWTATASSGTLKVKQFDHTAEQNVTVLLNVEGGTPEQLEECFRLCRSACEDLERRKIPYGLRTNGDLRGPVGQFFYLADGLGSRHLGTILYALGQAEYTRFHSFAFLVKQTLDHRRSNESYIIITPSIDASVGASLRKLENAVGNALCILTGEREAAQ